MGTAGPWGSFLLKLAQFPLISCTNRIYSRDKVKCQLQQYLIIYRSKARIAKALDVHSLQPNPMGQLVLPQQFGVDFADVGALKKVVNLSRVGKHHFVHAC
jgi:hypothetical protein